MSNNTIEKKKLSKATLDFLVSGTTAENLYKTLQNVARNMKECGYTLPETFGLINDKNVPGLGKLTPENMQIIVSIFTPSLVPTTSSSGNKNSGALMEGMHELLAIFRDNLLIYQDETFFWRDTDSNIVKKITFNQLKPIFFSRLAERNMALPHKQLVELMKTFTTFATPYIGIDKIPASFSITPGELTFRYIDIQSMMHEAPTPTWDVFLKNCGANGKSLAAFVWMLLNPQYESRQYLLMVGQGRNGKGSFNDWLMKLLGTEGYTSENPKNDHWLASCVGKRVCFFNELQGTSFVMSGNFKAVTGGDSVTISNKYEKAFSTVLETKFILSTNSSIDIENSTASKSRCILVTMDNKPELITDFKAKLQAETAGFLYKCKKAFDELYDTSLFEIRTNYENFDMESETFSHDYELLWQRTFKYEEGAKLRSILFSDAIAQTSNKYDKYFRQNFKLWMFREKGIEQIKVKGYSLFKNLTLKHEMISTLSEKDLD